MVDAMNVTTSAMNMTVISNLQMGWAITILVFLIIIVSLMLISKNIRIFIYGAILTVILGVIGFIANSIGTDAGEGNYYPLKVFCVIVGFIGCSLLGGYILNKAGWIDKFEDKYMGEKDENN